MASYYQHNVRRSMSFSSRFIQRLLTLVTGKPVSNQNRVIKSALIEIFLTLILLFSTTILPVIYFDSLSVFAVLLILLPCWIVSTGSLRKLQVTYAHHAVHNCLIGANQKFNNVLLFITTVIPVVQNGRDYKVDHLGHHDFSEFTTAKDSDAGFLISLGFVPGKRTDYYLKLLIKTIVSPRFHIVFFLSRVKSCLARGRIITSLISAAWLLVLILFVLKYPLASLMFVLIPMTFLYQASALLQFITEHAWLKTTDAPVDDADYAARCWGRFTGEVYPKDKGLIHTFVWWLKMIFYHMPTRIAVLPGDLPVHDWHHMAGKFGQSPTNWQGSIYLREVIVQQGESSIRSNEIWGLHNMIMNSFDNLSKGEMHVYR